MGITSVRNDRSMCSKNQRVPRVMPIIVIEEDFFLSMIELISKERLIP